jgi:hypothetical protein
MGSSGRHQAVQRVVDAHDAETMTDLLADGLSGADLTAVLLEVFRRRSARLGLASVLDAYER